MEFVRNSAIEPVPNPSQPSLSKSPYSVINSDGHIVVLAPMPLCSAGLTLELYTNRLKMRECHVPDKGEYDLV